MKTISREHFFLDLSDADRKYFGLLIEEGRKELLDLFNEYSSRNPDVETFNGAIAAMEMMK